MGLGLGIRGSRTKFVVIVVGEEDVGFTVFWFRCKVEILGI